jgi:predicted Zn finger-like uncharacterized protein
MFFNGPGMILSCTSCGTRYAVDGSKFPAAGRTVRCAKCGNSWHQAAEAPPESQPDTMAASAAPGQGVPAHQPENFESFPANGASPTHAFVPQPAQTGPRTPIGPALAVVAGWVGLIAVVLLIAVSAVRYRQDIAVIWPQSAGVYSRLGLHVSASEIDFRQVKYHQDSEDGQVVLAVTGVIVNAGPRELPVPQTVRVTLSDASNHELYHWTFKPSATVLGPGQSVPFVTRLSSPPAAARHLEVRFAKDGS